MSPPQVFSLESVKSLPTIREKEKVHKPLTYFCLVSSFNCSASSAPLALAVAAPWLPGFDILPVLTANDLALAAESLISDVPFCAGKGETAMMNVSLFAHCSSIGLSCKSRIMTPDRLCSQVRVRTRRAGVTLCGECEH